MFSDFTLFPNLIHFLPPSLSISSDFTLFALFYSYMLVFLLHSMRNYPLALGWRSPVPVARSHPIALNPIGLTGLRSLGSGQARNGEQGGHHRADFADAVSGAKEWRRSLSAAAAEEKEEKKRKVAIVAKGAERARDAEARMAEVFDAVSGVRRAPGCALPMGPRQDARR